MRRLVSPTAQRDSRVATLTPWRTLMLAGESGREGVGRSWLQP
jgi:hypothetical protein